MKQEATTRWIWGGLAVVALALLGGFGAGVDTAPASASAMGCNAAAYTADAVEAPTAAQLAAYAGRYQGHEGSYDAWGAFDRAGSAELVLGAARQISYKGAVYEVSSVCIDKADGAQGKVMYVESGAGHFDVSDRAVAPVGQAWGVSPADGVTVFTGGRRQAP
jgi:hypothetical protein